MLLSKQAEKGLRICFGYGSAGFWIAVFGHRILPAVSDHWLIIMECLQEGMTQVLEWRDKNGKTPRMPAEGRRHRELLRFYDQLKRKKTSFSGVKLSFDWRLVYKGNKTV